MLALSPSRAAVIIFVILFGARRLARQATMATDMQFAALPHRWRETGA